MKIFKSLGEYGVMEATENISKEQKEGFLSMLFGTLGASLLGNLLSGKEVKATRKEQGGAIRAGQEATTASQGQGSTRLRTDF